MTEKRTKLADEQLITVSGHLLYEIQMLFGTAETIRRLSPSDATDARGVVIRNALIESFTVHARNLLDFFYRPSQLRPDDAIAEDFFDHVGSWLGACPPKSALLATVHTRVGKEVAHLTYSRLQVTHEAKQWSFSEIAGDIAAVLRVFSNLVPSIRVCSSFRKEVANVHQPPMVTGSTAYSERHVEIAAGAGE